MKTFQHLVKVNYWFLVDLLWSRIKHRFRSSKSIVIQTSCRSVHLKEKHPCKICDYIGPSKKLLSQHTKNKHYSERIVCSKCNRSMKSASLKSHLRFYHSENQFCCKICAFNTIYKSALKQHVETVHQKLDKFSSTCTACKKSIKSYNLNRHIKVYHSQMEEAQKGEV